MASIIDGGQQQNVEIISVIGFIEQTIQTKLWRTVEDVTGHQFDPIGNTINLNKISIYKIKSILTFEQKFKLHTHTKYTRLVNDTITRFKNDKSITENIAKCKRLQVQQPETLKYYT